MFTELRKIEIIIFLTVLIAPVFVALYFLATGTALPTVQTSAAIFQVLGVLGLIAFRMLPRSTKN